MWSVCVLRALRRAWAFVVASQLLFVPSQEEVSAALHQTFDIILSTAGSLENIYKKLSGTAGHKFKADGWIDDAEYAPLERMFMRHRPYI